MTFAFHLWRTTAWAVLLSCVAGEVVTAQAFAVGRRGDGVLISSFGVMTALALGPRHIFAATPAGVVAYDFAFDRWELPLTEADGYPAGERPTALAYDRSAGVLWLGTAEGSLSSLTPGIDRWDRVTTIGIAAIVAIIPFSREGALYLATEGGWQQLRTGSFIATPIPPSAVPEAVRAAAADERTETDPFLRAARGTLGLDAAMRRWRLSDVERGERPGEYWIATLGGGLLRYDTRFSRSEWLPFGTVSEGAGAIAVDEDRIWFGGDGRGPRNGVASADHGLQQWTQFDAGYDGAPAGAVVDILATAGAVWFAASDGLYRMDRAGDTRAVGGRQWRRYTTADGLPSDAAIALAAVADGLWVGTTRGLVRLQENGTSISSVLMPGVRINGFAGRGDTLWIASDEGLRIVPPASSASVADSVPRPVPAAADPGPGTRGLLRGGRIVDVQVGEDAIYAAGEEAYFQFSGGEWTETQRGGAQARVGRVRRIAVEGGALWLGGERGLARLEIATGLWTYFIAGQELPPGPVRAVVPIGEHVWVATPAGAFRLRWRR